jgi:hypothetical protein
MRNYSLYLVLVSTLLASHAHANFSFGGMAGANFSTFSGSINRTGVINTSTYSGFLGPSGSFGYQIGGVARYSEESWFLELDTLYTSRSMKWQGKMNQVGGSNSVRNNLQITINQIELPFMGFYKINYEKFDVKIGLGFYASYGLGKLSVKDDLSNIPGSVASSKGSYTWQDFGFRRFNIGGLLGAGLEFKMGGTSLLGVELRAQSSFTDYRDTINVNFDTDGNKVGVNCLNLNVSYIF